MSELGSASSEANNDFLAEHEKEVRDFLDIVHGSLDRATSERGNNGQLIKPINDENLFAVKWDTNAPQLPERLAALTTFAAGVPVTVQARYRYGEWASMVNIWISPQDTIHKSFSLGLRVDPRTGEVSDFGSTASASEYGGQIRIDEEEAKAVVDAIFAGNPEYQSGADGLSVTDAFQLGIATQSDFNGEQYTVEVAEKTFAAHSRRRNVVQGGQFDLKVRVLDRSHPNGEPSKTWVTLKRHVEPVDYDPNGVLDGIFEQELEIVKEADGRIRSITRKSSVKMFDEPAVTRVNGKETVVTMLNVIEDGIPPKLAEKLYPTPEPTIEDLQFFQRLLSQPITGQDLYVS
ncbi:hypothetical protein IPL85_01105 [Candidatus Saccharibacteria bacterium]|nr:MAG: hypothetical protein IPL85_01105 [Candidatus Saccharibacteria bacterium]